MGSEMCIRDSYCTVEVFDKETMQWISKQDVGTMGYTEKEKSQASDSFKRACFNWGIGRELYTAPFIWVPAGKALVQMKEGPNKEKRYYCNERFSVLSIAYSNDREISGLVISNDKGQKVYELKAKADTGRRKEEEQSEGKKEGVQQRQKTKKGGLSREQMEHLHAELGRTGVAMEDVKERYQIQEPEAMGEELYKKVMAALSKTKTAA